MAYTWGEIQIASIQKMFLNNTNVVVSDLPTMKTDNKYKIYLNAMPQTANEGLLKLMGKGRPYIKSYTLTQFPLENLLGETYMNTFQHTNEDIEYETEGAKSYYFEVDNLATIYIYVNDVLFETIDNTSRTPGVFTVYKGFITSTTTDTIKIVFSGDHPYNYRYIALYSLDYNYVPAEGEEDDDITYIPDYIPMRKYNLTTLISDFYKISSVVFENGQVNPKTINDYRLEGDSTLCIDNSITGNWIIYYVAYPIKLTSSTADSTSLTISDEMAVLLPLYIASQLFKDDDSGLATQYRNEFEVGVEDLYALPNDLEFISTSGWL